MALNCIKQYKVWLAGSSGLGREVDTRAERARGVKRGHRGHLETLLLASQTLHCLIQFNATSQTLYIERKQKASAEESVTWWNEHLLHPGTISDIEPCICIGQGGGGGGLGGCRAQEKFGHNSGKTWANKQKWKRSWTEVRNIKDANVRK